MNLRNLSLITALLLSTFLTAAYPAESCHSLFLPEKTLSAQEIELRHQIVTHSYNFGDGGLLLTEMQKDGSLVYVGNHEYEPGTEFLASNEFDWAQKTIKDSTETDVIIGFGTNTAWDIALGKKAKHMVIADWSPWPVIAQRYLVQPLLRTSKTPQEFILQLAGIPKENANGLSLSEAFTLARQFSSFPAARVSADVTKHLKNLAEDPSVSELELKFLSTYFMPRLGRNISLNGFGPFPLLRHPSFAMLYSFYQKRYDPSLVGNVESVFSSLENFNYLKNLFDSGHVSFGITSVTDMAFYEAIKEKKMSSTLKRITLSVTNIFDCGCYNGLTFSDFRKYLKETLKIFKSSVTVFRTTNNVPPHGYYKYDLKTEEDIPVIDEFDSSALDEHEKRAG